MQMETIMTPVTKPTSKTTSRPKAPKPDGAKEKVRQGRVEGDRRYRLAKAEAADAAPTAAANVTPPASDGGKEPKKDKKAPGLAKLAKSSGGQTRRQATGRTGRGPNVLGRPPTRP